MMDLVVAPCSHDAAKHAVMRWHYSSVMPAGKLVRFGAWEDGTFIGAVIFGRGASPHLGNLYGLGQTEVCELVRVALNRHQAPVSQIVAASLRQLTTTNPGLKLVISFADPTQNHHGGIYQAGNWLYLGTSGSTTEYKIGGRWMHTRGAYWHPLRTEATEQRTVPGKHRYAYPLTRKLRKQIAGLVEIPPRPTVTA